MTGDAVSDGESADTSPVAAGGRPVARVASLATGLMVGAVIAAVGSVVLLGCAAAFPVVLGGPDPLGWTELVALPVGGFAFVMLVLVFAPVAWSARLLAAGGMAVLLVVSGWLVWVGLPEPGPEFGLGRRIPWVLVGCGLGVVAAVLYAAGAAPLRRRAGGVVFAPVATSVPAGVVVLVLAAASVVGVRGADEWTGAQNLDVARADGPLQGQRASALDGSKRWQVATTDAMAATRGGFVVVAGPGVYAVDPTTGKQRWHYFRWGSAFEGPVVASPDGRYVAVTAGLDSSVDRFLSGGSSSSQVYVFDAQRGRLLARIDAHGGKPRYVGKNVVVVDDGQESPQAVTAYRYTGKRAWRATGEKATVDEECRVAAVAGVGSGVLVAHGCGDRVEVSVRDTRTGREQWSWQHLGDISPDGVVVPETGPGNGTVLLDLTQGGAYSKKRATHLVTALDARTGKKRWSRSSVRVGRAENEAASYFHAAVHAAGTLVLAGSREHADGPPVELVALDPASGKERWRRMVALDSVLWPDFDETWFHSVIRPVGDRLVLAGRTSESEHEAFQIKTVAARSGRTVSKTVVPFPFSLLNPSVYVVGESVAVGAERGEIGSSEARLAGLG